jgi:2-oxoglutarate dehydrogenase E1 component
LSGQDSGRGTFSHRHSVYHDVRTGETFTPLSTINPDKVEFCVYDSPLSEMAVLGFEYGNAICDPTFLTIWEAQFGDFANGAQIIIDQFLSSGESKWFRMNGLVLLLPHGYEGQGAEHSSARLERFLQLCAQENMQVCNFTTPAQLFHGMRRQIKRDFRKPLVVMSPKSLLRHPKVFSTVQDLATGTFQEVLPDLVPADPKSVEKVILCSGKLFYDLDHYREAHPENAKGTTIIRVEQLYPYPAYRLHPMLTSFTNLKKVIWAQEEPSNMGAHNYIWPRLMDSLAQTGLNRQASLTYVGRDLRAAPATGSPVVHAEEQNAILEKCFGNL